MKIIPESAIDEERLNRKLKKELAILQHDENQLIEKIRKLEDRNMELICSNFQMDWNLMYQDDSLPEDYWPVNFKTEIKNEDKLPYVNPPEKYKLINLDQNNHKIASQAIEAEYERSKEYIANSGLILHGKEIKLREGYLDSSGQKYYRLSPISEIPKVNQELKFE